MSTQTEKQCRLKGCDSKTVARELCWAHYGRMRRKASLECEVEGCDYATISRKNFCKVHYEESLVKPARVIQAMTPCRIEGCGRPSRSKNMCSVHGYREANGLSMNAPIKNRVRNVGRKCRAEGCEEYAKVKLMCHLHYSRYKSFAVLDKPRRNTPSKKYPVPCKIDDCYEPSAGLGMCKTHYSRYYKGLKINAPIRKRMRNIGVECKIEGCKRPAQTRHMCNRHYNSSLLETNRQVLTAV